MGKAELKLEVDETLLAQIEAFGLDPRAIAISALVAAVPPSSDQEKAERWGLDNAEAIRAHREQIEQHGVFGEDLRTW